MSEIEAYIAGGEVFKFNISFAYLILFGNVDRERAKLSFFDAFQKSSPSVYHSPPQIPIQILGVALISYDLLLNSLDVVIEIWSFFAYRSLSFRGKRENLENLRLLGKAGFRTYRGLKGARCIVIIWLRAVECE